MNPHPPTGRQRDRRRRRGSQIVAWTLALLPSLIACQASPDGRPPRPFVISSATQLGDLYTRGELTDRDGHRWNAWIIPGVVTSLEAGGEAAVDGLDFAVDPFEAAFWTARVEDIGDGIDFAVDDCLKTFLVQGIADDATETREAIAANVRDAPFGWIPRVIGNALWGWLIKPTGRVVIGSVGMLGGLVYAASAPALQVAARPTGGLAWVGLMGLAAPAARIAAHHPIYLASIVNREPSEEQDGRFGLEIITRAAGSPAPVREAKNSRVLDREAPSSPEVEAWSDDDHRRALREDPDYRRGYLRGLRVGRRRGGSDGARSEEPAAIPEAAEEPPNPDENKR